MKGLTKMNSQKVSTVALLMLLIGVLAFMNYNSASMATRYSSKSNYQKYYSTDDIKVNYTWPNDDLFYAKEKLDPAKFTYVTMGLGDEYAMSMIIAVLTLKQHSMLYV